MNIEATQYVSTLEDIPSRLSDESRQLDSIYAKLLDVNDRLTGSQKVGSGNAKAANSELPAPNGLISDIGSHIAYNSKLIGKIIKQVSILTNSVSGSKDDVILEDTSD